MREILKALTEALASGGERLLCQVVETRGSTPQKAGAAMVVDPADGGQVGTLGGGCVEDEVKAKALRRVGRDGAEMYRFVLNHDYAWADGLICGGKMVIVAESLRGAGPLAYFEAIGRLLESGGGFTEAVIVEPDRVGGGSVGSRFLFGRQGELVAGWPSEDSPPGVLSRLVPIATRPVASMVGGVAVLPTLPRIRLVIVGAGHVGQAVAELAARADFEVWVVDDRPQYASRGRFPWASRIVVGPFAATLPDLAITPDTYALIVTRGHGHDQEALSHLAATPAGYVGLIGSRRKIRLIFDELSESGMAPEALARVSAPVGVAIGSQTVFEIAISIVAELIARRNLGSVSTKE